MSSLSFVIVLINKLEYKSNHYQLTFKAHLFKSIALEKKKKYHRIFFLNYI